MQLLEPVMTPSVTHGATLPCYSHVIRALFRRPGPWSLMKEIMRDKKDRMEGGGVSLAQLFWRRAFRAIWRTLRAAIRLVLETFGEPVVELGEHLASLVSFAPSLEQAGKADRRAEFEKPGALPAGDVDR